MKWTKLVKAEEAAMDKIFDNYINDLNNLKNKMSKISKQDIGKNSNKINEAMKEISGGISDFYLIIEMMPHVK